MLAVLDKEADTDRRFDGALLIAMALNDLALIRKVFYTLETD